LPNEHTATSLPFLSKYEPIGASEGSVDPLGLQNVAERLADLLLPGFTVRVERARCLTLATLAVEIGQDSALTSRDDDPQRAIIAFERLCVYALAREVDKTIRPLIYGFPGRLKALRAVEDKQPLMPSNYVRGPATNGLVGTYFRAARTGGLFNEDFNIQARGHELLRAWERETADSNWPELRKRVIQFLQRDLEDKDFNTKWAWFSELAYRCALNRTKVGERTILRGAIFDSGVGLQGSTLERLQMADCLHAYNPPKPEGEADLADQPSRGEIERSIVKQLAASQSTPLVHGPALQAVAQTILDYEGVARILTTAFDVLRYASRRGHSVSFADVLRDRQPADILKKSANALIGQAHRLRLQADSLQAANVAFTVPNRSAGEVIREIAVLIDSLPRDLDSRSLLQWLIKRHHDVQAGKSKQPWLLQDGSERFRFFQNYVLGEAPKSSAAFLFAYRLLNAYSVLDDLRLLN